MREAWAQVFDGVSLIAGAVGALLRGPEVVGTPDSRRADGADHSPERSPAAPAPSAHDPFLALAKELAARVLAKGAPPPPAAPSEPVDAPPAAPAAPADVEDDREADDPPADPLARFLPCEELARQRREPSRREALARDPLDAMDKAAYYLTKLEVNPDKAEDVTRSIEALPGAAPDRVRLAFAQGGTAAWQTYARLYDDCQRFLQRCRAGAAKAQAAGITDVLDPDREGRILFWLGDRPDVESLLPDGVDGSDARALDLAEMAVEPLTDAARDAMLGGANRPLAPDDGAPLRIHPLVVPTMVGPEG